MFFVQKKSSGYVWRKKAKLSDFFFVRKSPLVLVWTAAVQSAAASTGKSPPDSAFVAMTRTAGMIYSDEEIRGPGEPGISDKKPPSSSKFSICFTHVHNVSPMFIHFPTFSPACCSERTWHLHFFCKKSPFWRATTGAQLPLQDAQLSEGRVDANEQRIGTKM